MKKFLVVAIVIVLAATTGFFAYRYANPNIQKSTALPPQDPPQISSSGAAAGSSALMGEVQAASSADKAAGAAKNSKDNTRQTDSERIMAAISLDWEKYTLKASQPKVLKGKTYSTYDIWDEDYVVGPKVLVDQSSKSIYTWAPSDSAPVPAAQDKAFDKTVRTVTGIVKDGAMMSVTLTTSSGSELTVRRLGIDTSNLTSLKIGDKIMVTYTGIINGNDTSRAFITKLENVP